MNDLIEFEELKVIENRGCLEIALFNYCNGVYSELAHKFYDENRRCFFLYGRLSNLLFENWKKFIKEEEK